MIYDNVQFEGGALEMRKIGTKFDIKIKDENIVLKVVDTNNKSCKGCYFGSDIGCFDFASILGSCSAFLRSDRKSVIFEKVG